MEKTLKQKREELSFVMKPSCEGLIDKVIQDDIQFMERLKGHFCNCHDDLLCENCETIDILSGYKNPATKKSKQHS